MAINWSDDSYRKISQMNIGGQDYYIKDAAAREEIEKISSYTKFLGVTTTVLTDGKTGADIVVNEETVTAKTGDIAIYGSKEFIFNGTAWNEFGDLDAITDVLGDLAYNNTASGDFTPAGSIVVDGSFVGSEATISVSGSTTGEIVIVTQSSRGNYQPEGTVDVGLSTTPLSVVNSATQGTLPEFSASLLTASVSGEVLTFNLVANGFSAGTLPTFTTSNVISSVTTDPSFVGHQVDITFSAASITLTGSYTPELASTPTYTFSGTQDTIVVEGSVSKPTT